VVFHADGGYAEEMLEEAKRSPDLSTMACFEPGDRSGPWPYPICVFEVRPSDPRFDVVFREGWSGPEEWGRWAEGTESRASWAAPASEPRRLALDVFPSCVPGQTQGLTVEVNGATVAEHRWQDCTNWAAEIAVPAALVKVGWNEIVLRSEHADRPADVTGGENPDTRALSVGVSKLALQP
jgi:hypothetical protein